MEQSPGERGHDPSPRALAHQNRILRQIANDEPLGELLESICEYGNAELPEAITSIQSADHSGTFLQFTAGSRASAIHVHIGKSMPISPRADWCGLAAYRREPVIVADTATHASWTKHRAFAREFQIAACWVIPILDTRPGEGSAQATTRATITVYRRRVGEPDADATATLATMSDMARMAIERNQARQALIESETRQRLLFDHASDAMFLHDATGTILDVNRQACALLRASRDELLGTSATDFDLDLDAVRLDDVGARLERGELVALESRFRRRDGSEFPVEVRTASFFARERRYTIGLIRDLTDVRAAQQALREQAAMLRRAQEIAQLTSWTYDVARRTWGLGEPGSTLLGTRVTDRQPSISDLLAEVHEADRNRVADAWQRVLAGQRLDLEYRVLEQGEIRWRHSVAELDSKTPARVTGATRDITQRRSLEAQLALAHKMEALGLMAGGVAHDFNNLLTIVLGQTDLLLDGLPKDHRLYPALQTIVAAGEQGARLTNQLLGFSRQAKVELRRMDLNAAIALNADLLRHLLGPSIELILELQPELGAVRAEPGQIERLLINLGANAREAMPNGGRLRISTAVVDADLGPPGHGAAPTGRVGRLIVEDNGCGMTEAVCARAFEPFFSTKERSTGVGLGLATVFSIVKRAGGHIAVEAAPDSGSRFTILLPLATEDDSELPIRTLEPVAPPPAAEGETVLIVEDSADVRRIARLSLEQRGYAVLVAASGNDALRIAAANAGRIDLLLTDVVIPDLHGREIAERLRATRPELKVLYMSGYSDDVLLHRGVDQTTHAFLQKPFTPSELAARVRALLDGTAAHASSESAPTRASRRPPDLLR